MERRPAIDDLVSRKGVNALLRQRSGMAVKKYRNKGAASMRGRWRQLFRGMGSGTVAALRSVIEFEPRHPSRGSGKRATRIRLSLGMTEMRLLPTKEEMRLERRTAYNDPSVIRHFLFTRRGADLVQWDYVRGAGSAGIRRYRSETGEE